MHKIPLLSLLHPLPDRGRRSIILALGLQPAAKTQDIMSAVRYCDRKRKADARFRRLYFRIRQLRTDGLLSYGDQ